MDPRLNGTRACSHPACDWPAVASMGFDYEARLAWLEELHADSWQDRYSLCGLHAEKFRAPVGWGLDDRRGLSPRQRAVPPIRVPPPVKVEAGRELASERAEPPQDRTRQQAAVISGHPLFDI